MHIDSTDKPPPSRVQMRLSLPSICFVLDFKLSMPDQSCSQFVANPAHNAKHWQTIADLSRRRTGPPAAGRLVADGFFTWFLARKSLRALHKHDLHRVGVPRPGRLPLCWPPADSLNGHLGSCDAPTSRSAA